MLTPQARIAIIVVAAVLLGFTIYESAYEVTAMVACGILFVVYGYFKEGTVILASKAYHDKDLDKTEKLLSQVPNPDYLKRSRRGYYEFMLGNLELKRENFAEAERHFQIASRFPLKNENEKAIVLTQLANLNLRKKEFEKAKAYIDVAKGLKISTRVQDIINKIEKETHKASE